MARQPLCRDIGACRECGHQGVGLMDSWIGGFLDFWIDGLINYWSSDQLIVGSMD
jgi:hypothetical protein